jgi:tetratricopeptide (TPR) repeat protein
MTLHAQPSPLQERGTFTVEVKPTAAEQFAYATSFSAAAGDPSQRKVILLRSVAALQVIPQRWPAERALALRAYREIVTRLAGSHFHRNAVEVCDRAIAFAGRSEETLVFLAAKGRSLAWLGRTDEARDAFAKATTGAFHRLPDFDKSAILIDATWFYTHDGNFAAAARHAHARARFATGALGPAEAMRRAVELRLLAKEHALARETLTELSAGVSRARLEALTPDEQEALRRIEASIQDFRKTLTGG